MLDYNSPYMTIINIWKFWLLKIGLSPLLHRSCKPAVQIQYHNGYMWDIMTRPAVNRQGIYDLFVCMNWFSNRVILLKSLIANMAGFLLWLSITSIMIEVFKVASAQWLLFHQGV